MSFEYAAWCPWSWGEGEWGGIRGGVVQAQACKTAQSAKRLRATDCVRNRTCFVLAWTVAWWGWNYENQPLLLPRPTSPPPLSLLLDSQTYLLGGRLLGGGVGRHDDKEEDDDDNETILWLAL